MNNLNLVSGEHVVKAKQNKQFSELTDLYTTSEQRRILTLQYIKNIRKRSVLTFANAVDYIQDENGQKGMHFYNPPDQI